MLPRLALNSESFALSCRRILRGVLLLPPHCTAVHIVQRGPFRRLQSDGTSILVTKEMGLVNQVFDETRLAALDGHQGIGHVRYSTTGASTWDNAQPTFRTTPDGTAISVGHNGNLTNTGALARDLGPAGDKCTSDSDLLTAMICDAHEGSTDAAMAKVLPKVAGAYSLVVMDEHAVHAARDPHGVRPLVIGRLARGGWVVASETAALDIVGAVRVRDVEPGEIVGIVGPSGSGKSTVAKLLQRLHVPERGRVMIDGEVVPDVCSREDMFTVKGCVERGLADVFSFAPSSSYVISAGGSIA